MSVFKLSEVCFLLRYPGAVGVWSAPSCLQGLFQERFFHRNSNSMSNWFQCNSILVCHIATKFCTWQNFRAITLPQLGWEQNEMSIKFELRWKNRLCNGSQARRTSTWLRCQVFYTQQKGLLKRSEIVKPESDQWTRQCLSWPYTPWKINVYQFYIMTSSNWNVFRVTGFLWYFLWCQLKQTVAQTDEAPWWSLWRHCNGSR